MGSLWKTIPIFISSTFRDMHAERDHLTKVVFPDLEEKLKPLRCRIEPIDLRMGVETEDAKNEEEREHQILKVCLQEIERSRPFLLVLLGDRYGWVPKESRIRAALEEEGFDTHSQGKSVTALEIEYGLLIKNAEQRRRSFLYLRDPLPYEIMSQAVAAVYSDAHATDPFAQTRAEHLTKLKDRILSDETLKPHVRTYSLEWNQGINPKGMEAWGVQVTTDLFDAISEEVATSAPKADPTWQESERFAIEEVVERLNRSFVGRSELVTQALDLAISPVEKKADWGLCFTGESGSGKSALFARIHKSLEGRSDVLVLSHAAGVSPDSTYVPFMLLRWVIELVDFLNDPHSLPEDWNPEDLEKLFSSLLLRATKKIRVLVLVDALNQFLRTDKSEAMTWLPVLWPDNARFISTAIPGPETKTLYRKSNIKIVELPPLAADEVNLIAAAVYSRYHRKPNADVLAELRKKCLPDGSLSAGNPLWLSLSLDLLNLLDADDFARAETENTGTPEERLKSLVLSRAKALPETMTDLNAELILQVEQLVGVAQTRAFCSLIALSRNGWREEDFQHLLPGAACEFSPGQVEFPWDPLLFAILRRAFRYHLVRRGAFGQFDFAHQSLRKAIHSHLQTDWRVEPDTDMAPALHSRMADYLETLSPEEPVHENEIMWQMLGTRNGQRVANYYALPTSGSQMLAKFLVEDWETVNRPLLNFVLLLLPIDDVDEAIRLEVARKFLFTLPEEINRNQGKIHLKEQLLANVKNYLEIYCDKSPQDIGLLSACHNSMGNLYRDMGRQPESLSAYQKALAIREVLLEKDPVDDDVADGLDISHNNMGVLYSAMGHQSESLSAYQKALAILEVLHEKDPGNAEVANRLAACHNNMGVLYRNMGRQPESLSAYQKALAIREGLHEKDPVDDDVANDLAMSHNNMGLLYRDMGRQPESLIAYQKALAIGEDLLEKDPGNAEVAKGLAMFYRNMGVLYSAMGRQPESLIAHQKALAIGEDLLEKDPGNAERAKDLSLAYNSIGVLYIIMGHQPESLNAYQKALAIGGDLLEKDPGNAEVAEVLAMSHDNLGNLYNAMGYEPESLISFQKALAICEDLLEKDPGNVKVTKDLAGCLHNMGVLYSAMGRQPESLNAYQKALAICEDLHEKDSGNAEVAKDLAMSYDSMGVIYSDMGRQPESLNAYQKALAICEDLHEKDSGNAEVAKSLAIIYNSMGDLYSDMGRQTVSLNAYQKALAIREELHEKDPGNVEVTKGLAMSHLNIGALYSTIGQQPESLIAHYQKALAIFECLPEKDPENAKAANHIAGCHFNIGVLYGAMGRRMESLIDYGKALAIYEGLHEKDPENAQVADVLAKCHNNLEAIYNAMGRQTEPVSAFGKTLAVRESMHKKDPGNAKVANDLAISYNSMGILYNAMGRQTESLSAYQKALAIREDLLEKDPIDDDVADGLAISHNNMGALYSAMGRQTESLSAYQKALATYMGLHEKDPGNAKVAKGLAACHNNMGLLYRDMSRQPESLSAYQKALAIYTDLHEKDPDDDDVANDLAACHNDMGFLYSATGRQPESLISYQKTLVTYTELHEKDPVDDDIANDLARCHLNMGLLYSAMGDLPQAIISAEKGKLVVQYTIEYGMFIPESTINALEELNQEVKRKQSLSFPVHIPTPHRGTNPEEESRKNIEYQEKLAKWKALSWWKRVFEKRPEKEK